MMNQRQYRISKAELKRFDEALADHAKRDVRRDVDPHIHAAMGAALQSEADELWRQLQEYDDLREKRIRGHVR